MSKSALSNQPKIARFADRLAKLANDYRDDVAGVVEEIKAADLDVPAVRRLAAWTRRDPVKRAEQEAIDEQYRFLAGETETPAMMPDEGPLAEAAKLYADKLSVRQVAGVLKVSVGRAQKLKTLAGLFTVHVHEDVNTPPIEIVADLREITNPETAVGNPPGGGEGTADVTSGPGVSPADLSCGDGESRPVEDDGGGEPAELCPQVAASGQHIPDGRTAPLSTIAEHSREVAGVAPGPQDTIDPGPIPHFLKRERATA